MPCAVSQPGERQGGHGRHDADRLPGAAPHQAGRHENQNEHGPSEEDFGRLLVGFDHRLRSHRLDDLLVALTGAHRRPRGSGQREGQHDDGNPASADVAAPAYEEQPDDGHEREKEHEHDREVDDGRMQRLR